MSSNPASIFFPVLCSLFSLALHFRSDTSRTFHDIIYIYVNVLYNVTGLSFYTSEKTLRAAFEGFGELVEGIISYHSC